MGLLNYKITISTQQGALPSTPIRKYYSSSSTSAYICTCRHVGNSRKRHNIDDGAKNGAKWQMSPNVGPTFSDMSPTCRPTHQCRVEIGNADI